MSENASELAERLAIQSTGNMTAEFLIESETATPLISYLQEGEQPQYVFDNARSGVRIEHPDWSDKKTPYNSSFSESGRRYFLMTDRRIVFVAGDPDGGDDGISLTYDELTDAESTVGITKQYITIVHESGKRISFFDEGHQAEHLDDAALYIEKRIAGEIGPETGETTQATTEGVASSEQSTADLRSEPTTGSATDNDTATTAQSAPEATAGQSPSSPERKTSSETGHAGRGSEPSDVEAGSDSETQRDTEANQPGTADQQPETRADNEPTKLTLSLVLAWLAGGVTLLTGYSLFWELQRFSGLFYLASGAIMTPFLRRYIESVLNIEFSRWLVIALWLTLGTLGGFIYAATPA